MCAMKTWKGDQVEIDFQLDRIKNTLINFLHSLLDSSFLVL